MSPVTELKPVRINLRWVRILISCQIFVSFVSGFEAGWLCACVNIFLHLCFYVCLGYLHICVCICVWMSTHSHLYLYVCLYFCTSVPVCLDVLLTGGVCLTRFQHICACVYSCLYVCICLCVSRCLAGWLCVCLDVHTSVCSVSGCLYICLCLCV